VRFNRQEKRKIKMMFGFLGCLVFWDVWFFGMFGFLGCLVFWDVGFLLYSIVRVTEYLTFKYWLGGRENGITRIR
jgi:hypothetical protein